MMDDTIDLEMQDNAHEKHTDTSIKVTDPSSHLSATNHSDSSSHHIGIDNESIP